MLEASPDGVPGHATTVLGGPTEAKQTPIDLPLTVLGVVGGAGLTGGALLLVSLDLTDPVMAKIGGIAAGMSGSPVLVRDGAVDKVVGALSMGDIFATNGLALATPIQDMLSVERAGLSSMGAMDIKAARHPISPVTVDGKRITSVVVAPVASMSSSSVKSKAAADPSTAYFAPLFGVQIGGLPTGSTAYKRLASAAAEHGLRVLAPQGSGAQGSAADFETPLVPGAAVGAFYSLGGFSFGGIGTVTYTTDDEGLVAFGHPMMWTGRSDAFLTNAWIDGVWSSSIEPYKLGSAAKVRGTLRQDRGAGVGGSLGAGPVGVPLITEATVTADGRTIARTSTTSIAPISFSQWFRSDLPATAVNQALIETADAQALPGSARTTLTVGLAEGTKRRTVTRTSITDDGYDAMWPATWEVYAVLEAILENPEGTAPATVTSIHVSSDVTQDRRLASIVGITSPGLQTGRNTIQVAVRKYGSKTPSTVPVTLTIPAGMPTTGMVTATSGADALFTDRDTSSFDGLVDSLNAAPSGADVVVQFQPDGSEDVVRGSAHTNEMVQGEAVAGTSIIELDQSAKRITAGERVTLSGLVLNAPPGGTVKVERRTWGSPTWSTLASHVDLVNADDMAMFEFTDKPKYNARYRVSYAGADEVLGSSANTSVSVRGRVGMRGVKTRNGFGLVARVAPHRAGSRVTFERRAAGQWRAIKTVRTAADGRATYPWKVKHGTYQVRARLIKTTDLTGNVSQKVRLTR